MDGPLFWSFALLAAGLLLIIVEFFVPSGGVLAIASGLTLVGSIVVGFSVSPRWGMIMVVLVAVIVPVVLGMTVRLWPRTPMGRSIMARQPGDPLPDVLPDDDFHRKIKSLQGRVGVAASDMLPNGTIKIDGEKFDAVSSGGVIDRGQNVEVFRVDSGKLHVRATSRPVEENRGRIEPPGSPLDQPIEQLGIDSLEDPLA
ncbi:hypothetical protein CA51_39820 [Rosistilla oblonga]|uniref:NfeD-like C-terminal domain-containing protein n=1 Tax=Rosistilla oblonga TaxID=2527990 RepID=A0A518IXB2_9BACT|nr:NfeD family protein [Rosistilla oblonga]QDV14088.1 hypothetical protein CA51_39820 [Rosistilla oblonga]QDV57718.1 hypothetical protein Mal33_37310 [Rosistilla oblonga]